MVIGIDGVNRQFLFLNALKVIGSVIHLTVKIIIGKGATSDSILTGGIYDKTDPPHPVQQSVSVMFQFIVQFIRIKRNDLIEVDLLAARQSADLTAVLRTLGIDQGRSAQFRVFRKGFPVLHCMTMTQPAVTVDGQTGQGLQQADGPVPPLIFHGLLIQLPIRRQCNGQLRPLQLVFRQFLRHIHPVGAHTHGDQSVVVPFLRRRNNADVHMDVGGNQLVEHILNIAEILINVPLDGLHLLLGVDLGNTGFFILGCFIVRVIVIIVRVTVR